MLRRLLPVALLPVALLAAALAGCAPRATPPRAVRVMVYNIHAGKDAAGADNLRRVAEVVRGAAADVVLLQEVDRGTRRSAGVDQLAELARLTALHGAFGRSLTYQGGEYGIAVLSRWPITAQRTVPLPVDPPQERSGGAYEPRVALVATVASPAAELTIVNTHIDASREDRWRRQEIVTVLGLADSASGFVLLGGDLNSTPDSDIQERVRGRGLRDAWTLCGGPGNGFTYPADSSVKRIDYLYLPARGSCRRAEVLRTTASDHRPLLVDVVIP